MFDVATEGAVLVVTLDRPPVNAINDAWLDGLEALLDRHEKDAAIKVIRFRSARPIFCAGADIDLLAERLPTPQGVKAMAATARRMQVIYERIERSPLVSLAEINGAALGGGFELALACDLRIAADNAKLGLPEARLGLLPGAGGSQRMTKLCGAATAKRLILGAETVSGEEAVRLGLVHWVVPADQLSARAQVICANIASLPRKTLETNKRCIEAAQEPCTDGYAVEIDMTTILYQTPEALERLKAFLAKRKER
ncbi:MAG: enoyl-CoA hydratase/isomerase family protein [Rhodospirillales bacterium]|nr:enoyl-CoA hydratase/isomerase family protein [Rhodospirillales bacterium]